MNKINPDLGQYLAEEVIKQKYRSSAKSQYDLIQVAKFCKQRRAQSNIFSTYLKLQRKKINRIIVEIVWIGLPAEQQQFVLYRYRDNQSFTWIADQLHVCHNLLFCWNREILKEVKALLFYQLTENDIFNQIKVINLLHIIDVRIITFCDEGTDPIDVNSRWLNFLKIQRRKYRQLLTLMQNCINDRNSDKFNYVVAMKLMYPNYNVSEIAYECELSAGTVSKKLRQYMTMAIPLI